MPAMETILKALNFAAIAHDGQRRKDKELPYLIHPAGVALLLQQAGADPQTIAAGLLHDVIEDCGVTREEIETVFGKDVARMVADATEPKNMEWRERKRFVNEHLKTANKDSQMVKAADLQHNLWSKVQAYKKEGLKFFDRFVSSPQEQIKGHTERYLVLKEIWPENPLLGGIEIELKALESIVYPKK